MVNYTQLIKFGVHTYAYGGISFPIFRPVQVVLIVVDLIVCIAIYQLLNIVRNTQHSWFPSESMNSIRTYQVGNGLSSSNKTNWQIIWRHNYQFCWWFSYVHDGSLEDHLIHKGTHSEAPGGGINSKSGKNEPLSVFSFWYLHVFKNGTGTFDMGKIKPIVNFPTPKNANKSLEYWVRWRTMPNSYRNFQSYRRLCIIWSLNMFRLNGVQSRKPPCDNWKPSWRHIPY